MGLESPGASLRFAPGYNYLALTGRKVSMCLRAINIYGKNVDVVNIESNPPIIRMCQLSVVTFRSHRLLRTGILSQVTAPCLRVNSEIQGGPGASRLFAPRLPLPELRPGFQIFKVSPPLSRSLSATIVV